MKKITKGFRERIGDVLCIKLSDREYCYGRKISSTDIAYYGVKTKTVLSAEKVVKYPIIFILSTRIIPPSYGKWTKIGNFPLTADLLRPVKYFMRDPITGKYSITYDGDYQIPASRKEVEGLECLAVWDSNHIEERLEDYFTGRPNRWVIALSPDRPLTRYVNGTNEYKPPNSIVDLVRRIVHKFI